MQSSFVFGCATGNKKKLVPTNISVIPNMSPQELGTSLAILKCSVRISTGTLAILTMRLVLFFSRSRHTRIVPRLRHGHFLPNYSSSSFIHIPTTWSYSPATPQNVLTNLLIDGSAAAQAISCRLPTAATRALSRSGYVGLVVGKVALWQVFPEHFAFPCQFVSH
jgi:hypothetical protein